MGDSSSTARILWHRARSLGPKPGGDRVLAMLLTDKELPGTGWRLYREYTSRAGTRFRGSDAARRQRKARSVSAHRDFVNYSERRSLWVEVVPFGSEDDAGLAASHFVAKAIQSPGVSAVDWVQKSELSIPGAPEALIYESGVMGREGQGLSHIIVMTIEKILIPVVSAKYGQDRSLTDVIETASVQNQKVRQHLAAARSQTSGDA